MARTRWGWWMTVGGGALALWWLFGRSWGGKAALAHAFGLPAETFLRPLTAEELALVNASDLVAESGPAASGWLTQDAPATAAAYEGAVLVLVKTQDLEHIAATMAAVESMPAPPSVEAGGAPAPEPVGEMF